MSRLITIKDVCLSFSDKICFEHFCADVYQGNRIAIIGRNGSGKSCLVNILRKKLAPTSGSVELSDVAHVGYVEQTIGDFDDLSGGERFNARLSQAIAQSPSLLILDEPTNHLDRDNRKSLMNMLNRYQGTLIVVSHDTELLRRCIDTLWHIDHHQVHQFTGSYDAYLSEIRYKRSALEKEITQLKRDKRQAHQALMIEQKRAAKSRAKGKKSIDQRKWPTVVSKEKARRSVQTTGKKKAAIQKHKEQLTHQLSELRVPDTMTPTFSLPSDRPSSRHCITLVDGAVGYDSQSMILTNLSLTVGGQERIALDGKNGSGKSTLLKAIRQQDEIHRTGHWVLPSNDSIGYLDQHYSDLNENQTLIEHIKLIRPEWSDCMVRRHLMDFLFKTNAQVNQLVGSLSGGEKARLSLSRIAAKTPRLLILDEITNNLDLETKEHVIQVLKSYPGAMMIVSHDHDFLTSIEIDHVYSIMDGTIHLAL